MEEDRALYLGTCKDQNCTGTLVVEYSPPLSQHSERNPEPYVFPLCPICGREMKVSPMISEVMEFILGPTSPETLGLIIHSWIVFKLPPTQLSYETRPPLSETEGSNRALYFSRCNEQNCTGILVVEYSPPLSTRVERNPEPYMCPPCPTCGREMQMSLMVSEVMEFILDAEPSNLFSITALSRTLFQPPTNQETYEVSPILSNTGDEPNKADKGFFTEEDLARRLGVPVSTIWRLVKEKKLRCIQIKKGKRFFTEDIIDEFFRRESGLSIHRGPVGTNALGPNYNRNPMSIEEAREFMNKMPGKT